LGSDVVLVHEIPWSGLELSGEDRVRFLNGLLTCDVKSLAAGQGTYGFLTSHQGKVLADAIVLAFADALWVELAPDVVAEVRAHLEKYLIADRVTIQVPEKLAVRALGPAAAMAVERLLGALPAEPWSHRTLAWAGASVVVFRHARLGAPAISMVAAAETATALARALLESAPGLRPRGVETAALDALRVRAGLARFGVDFGRDHFPQETGAEAAAVSYTKGCYLGQEVVARIHYRGGVNRGLRGLRFVEDSPPAVGAALLAEGQVVGRVTSLASGLPAAYGLAILHKRGWEIGQRLEIEGGGAAVVTAPESP
jgi:tRNA-modifying protein YgfZ